MLCKERVIRNVVTGTCEPLVETQLSTQKHCVTQKHYEQSHCQKLFRCHQCFSFIEQCNYQAAF